MSNTRVVLVLFILSESLIAFYAAQSAFRTRSRTDGRRKVIGILVAAALTMYGIGQTFSVVNGIHFFPIMSKCDTAEWQQRTLAAGAIRTCAFWAFALIFSGDGDHPGWIRTRVYRLVEKFR